MGRVYCRHDVVLRNPTAMTMLHSRGFVKSMEEKNQEKQEEAFREEIKYFLSKE